MPSWYRSDGNKYCAFDIELYCGSKCSSHNCWVLSHEQFGSDWDDIGGTCVFFWLVVGLVKGVISLKLPSESLDDDDDDEESEEVSPNLDDFDIFWIFGGFNGLVVGFGGELWKLCIVVDVNDTPTKSDSSRYGIIFMVAEIRY